MDEYLHIFRTIRAIKAGGRSAWTDEERALELYDFVRLHARMPTRDDGARLFRTWQRARLSLRVTTTTRTLIQSIMSL